MYNVITGQRFIFNSDLNLDFTPVVIKDDSLRQRARAYNNAQRKLIKEHFNRNNYVKSRNQL